MTHSSPVPFEKNITSDLLTQNLEKEKRQLESAIKKFMQDLDKERGQKNLLSKQVTELEKLLDENKVAWHYHLYVLLI